MQPSPSNHPSTTPRDSRFWLVFVANLVVDLLSALDLTAVSTALPTIVQHLHGSEFIWVGSAYAIASTAILPTVGGLVTIFGRKPILICFITAFAVGSAICGAAHNMDMLIVGRAIQGLGGGGCIAVTEIIYADLVPLPERGKFQGITALVWALACGMGPPVGGALANSDAWRWIFYLNLPLCGIAILLVTVFLTVNTPRQGFKEKITQIDWLGLFLIIASTVAIMIGLTWGGIKFPWISPQVLVPVCLGAAGLVGFIFVEMFLAKEATVPAFLLTNRTILSGYLGTFFHGVVSMAVIFYLPIYFQACKLASPIRSGVDLFGLALTIAPFAIFTGLSVEIFKRYRPQNYVGWMLTIVGFSLLSTLSADSAQGKYIGYEVIVGIGLGITWISTQFPILAPLPYSNNAHALAFFTFLRCFAQSWGTVIGGAILQNYLSSRLPDGLENVAGTNPELIYALIPAIRGLSGPLQSDVRRIFAEGLALIWRIMIAFCAVGFLTCLLMREVPMRTALDEAWGLKDQKEDTIDMSNEENGTTKELSWLHECTSLFHQLVNMMIM
ncbi:MFS transporter superfamily protein [Pleurotus pulmonarius]